MAVVHGMSIKKQVVSQKNNDTVYHAFFVISLCMLYKVVPYPGVLPSLDISQYICKTESRREGNKD